MFTVRGCWPHAQPPSWRTTPCRLSATAYSIYSQLPSVPGGLPSTHNLRTRHAMVTRTHLTWAGGHFSYKYRDQTKIMTMFDKSWSMSHTSIRDNQGMDRRTHMVLESCPFSGFGNIQELLYATWIQLERED
jgi:hypothetical protein